MLIQDLLKLQRKNLNLTQEEVAEYLHVTTQAVSKWELGRSVPSIDNLLLLSDLYNISIDQLIQGSPFFKKPFVVGKKFNLKKGIAFAFCWTFISLLFTGFGYQPLWLFLLLLSVGLILVFPTVFQDYWLIQQQSLLIYHYSENSFKKIRELLTFKPIEQMIPYEQIKKVSLVYLTRKKFSPVDFNPDYLYLTIITHDQEIRLNLSAVSIREFLPQFTSFLERKHILIQDEQQLLPVLVSDTTLYEHFHQKNTSI